MSNIHKVWGERRRIHLDCLNEIDLLYIKKDTFCSTHTHKYKTNKFIVVQGKIRIETEFGQRTLSSNESWEVNPPIKHRFYALEDSVMIEIACISTQLWNTIGAIDPNDINRESQGGRIVNGKEMTLNEMREKGMLNL
ncbi:MAG: hypothetical protein ACTSPD_10300 [Promethearchaeota archaeon]